MITEDTRRALCSASILVGDIDALHGQIARLEAGIQRDTSNLDTKRQELERSEDALASIIASLAPKS